MIESGDRAPEFTFPDQDVHEAKLSGFQGNAVVVYLDPKADTLF